MNWYVYCANNPVNFVDPNGLLPIAPAIDAANQLIQTNPQLAQMLIDLTTFIIGDSIVFGSSKELRPGYLEDPLGMTISPGGEKMSTDASYDDYWDNLILWDDIIDVVSASSDESSEDINISSAINANDDDRVYMFRATSPEETNQIKSTGTFINPEGIEVKYFAITYDDAAYEGRKLNEAYDDGPYNVFGTSFPVNQITPDMIVNVDNDIMTVVIPTEKLGELSQPVDFGSAEEDDEGSIICTELYKQGLMDERIYRADENFGIFLQETNPEVIIGYHYLARPVVSLMKKSKIFTDFINMFAKPWSYEMAYKVGVREEGDFVGSIIMFIGIPLCSFVGNILVGNINVYILLFNILLIISLMLIIKYHFKLKHNKLLRPINFRLIFLNSFFKRSNNVSLQAGRFKRIRTNI